MADLNIRFDMRMTPALFCWGMAGLLLSAFATELSSESVALSIYYPAPSGAYTRMVTTADAYLSRDGGKVGIGTTIPGERLHVTARSRFGDMRIGDTGSGFSMLEDQGPGGMALTPTGALGTGVVITEGGKVGVGFTNPVYTLEASGDIVGRTWDLTFALP